MQLQELTAITDAMPLTALSMAQMKELQTSLTKEGYHVGPIDSLLGLSTRTAWADFKRDMGQTMADLIGPSSVALIQSRLNAIAQPQHDFTSVAGTMAAIRSECVAQGIGLNTQIAYVFATVARETAHKFQPVKEAFWLPESWREKNFKYFPYYGRGYVQLTWKTNYAKYQKILGIDLVGNPDLAMVPETSLFILVHGFRTGGFSGHKITEYINANQTDFLHCRHCINGMDHAAEIAEMAQTYLKTL